MLDRLTRRGPLLAALLSVAAALPAFTLPFIADDWVNWHDVRAGIVTRTAYHYFRPLYMGSIWLESRLPSPSPFLGHAINVGLVAAAAWLVVVLVRRYSGDARLATLSGVLFALHPWHYENAAWIAARSDTLYAVLGLAAALAYDRWRDRARGWPVAALLLFEASLLSKESAIILPPFLIALGLVDRRRRPAAIEWRRGLLPMLALIALQLLVLRPMFVGPVAAGVFTRYTARSGLNLLSYGIATIVPAHWEQIGYHFRQLAPIAAVLGLALVVAARRSAGGVPRTALAAAALFCVLIGPSSLGVQERYAFPATAASSLALAALLLACGRRFASGALLVLTIGWGFSLWMHWVCWWDAAAASTALVRDLTAASRRPGAEEIVIANLPQKVHGAPVYADLPATLEATGGRALPVAIGMRIEVPAPTDDALDAPRETAIVVDSEGAAVRLRLKRDVFHGYWPEIPPPGSQAAHGPATIETTNDGAVVVRVPKAPEKGRIAYVWKDGALRELF